MASLARCSSCRGFLPAGVGSCPNCGSAEPAAGIGGRIGSWLKVAGGASVAMTLMACYGVPVGPDDPTDTDPTEGTATGDEPTSSTGAEPTGGAGSTGSDESTGGGGSTGSGSSTGSADSGSDGSSGAGSVDERPLPER